MESDRNKDVIVYRYDPKKRYFLVSLHLENRPGALGNLANALGIRGINILEGYFGGITQGEYGVVSFFLEGTDTTIDEPFLRDFLQSLVHVSGVEVRGPVEGFVSDSLNFPVTWNNGDRAVIMRIEGLRAVLQAVRAANPQAGDAAIYNAGVGFGKFSWENLFETFRPKTKEGLSEILNIYSATGWGKPELLDLDLDDRRARVRMVDGFECAGISTGKPASNFIRGHLEASFSVFFETGMRAVETKCMSKGDPHCEFDLSPRPW